MNPTVDIDEFRHRIGLLTDSLMQTSGPHVRTRVLSLYSAAVAVCNTAILSQVISVGKAHRISRAEFYEIVLQSYLFLGFPRMLEAADHLSGEFPLRNQEPIPAAVDSEEVSNWVDRGLDLCKAVYDSSFDLLRRRVESFAPEIFRWMVLEGYGKVLSRPGVNIIDRELAIIACLMMENRERQLHSHIRGARNVGADETLIRQVVEDIGPSAGRGYEVCLTILDKLRYR